jgi:hypothetical protein
MNLHPWRPKRGDRVLDPFGRVGTIFTDYGDETFMVNFEML